MLLNSQKCYLVGISLIPEKKRQGSLSYVCLFVFPYTFDLTEELARAFAHSSSLNPNPLSLCDCFEPSEFRSIGN